jgi:hypothetical protein
MKKILVCLLLMLGSALGQQTGAMLGLNQTFTGNNAFSKGIFTGPTTVSGLSALVGATNFVYVTDGTLGSNPCSGSGTGAFASYVNGSWSCANGSIGIVITPGSCTFCNITYNAFGQITTSSSSSGGVGTVTSVSVITANGVSGSVANPTTTPAITLSLGAISPSSVTTPTFTLSGFSTGCLTNTSGAVSSTGVVCGMPVLTNQQVGDIPRFNVNGDNAWDSVNYAQSAIGVFPIFGSAQLQTTGVLGSTLISVTGSPSNINPTLLLQTGDTIAAAATASLNTVVGLIDGQNGNNSLIGMQAFYRLSARMAINQTTNARFWVGLACFNSSGTGSNTAAILGTTAYANDTPNKSTEAFRFSSGTDTHWQAVVITAGGSSTVVDTGVVPDTNTHLFEIAPNAAGTSLFFLIDGTTVATISTNIPPPANGANSWGDLFIAGDNKNTNNVVSFNFYSMQISLKQ